MTVGLAACLPHDFASGRFLGRALSEAGPHVIMLREGRIFDMTALVSTSSGAIARRVFDGGEDLGPVEQGLPEGWRLVSPIDLQCVKACGVTFALSAIERVIEERARGDAGAAAAIRSELEAKIGSGIRGVVPGSDEAMALKDLLIEQGMWSQYLEVAIGPDAEVFSKSPVLSTVGHDALIGVRSDSAWNNPEPEVVLAVDPAGEVVGAMLGNDVNLRDFEGRSALLLSKAKDNTASCALGPFIRLFDESFGIDDVRSAQVELVVEGQDNFRMEGTNRMSEISRDPLDLVSQTLSEHHYPDGFVLFCGTLFAPVQDRDEPGAGFTHKVGDRVTIRSERLGALANTVTTSRDAPAWTVGIAEFMRNLAQRNLVSVA
ncbi:MAG: fumarylacetoacetate hydrolase [Novosphingobium sp. 16-62-11]|uniref:fumarylacetoacetate hydrolase family protein n=1 Tax=Novosphingobium sp. 17-62-19 TaxID=1970406 RepID=UPI000BCFFFD4|nr:fumarylacetoacetate hydrolase family protein [Novosphingobium sp. 17-62-19]OYZ46580.1 MAG: fumarylacetoacetate hydrolase [Novosphingobium sp. 16-62-11]OZA21623.1 MAG: fumarylacetoacetate hydrolase [Novosphingobium sp. 17-62-19]HQS95862.1 fumarylacetoacetate hydrolase family protein [Novosphingobium sp.]